MPVSPKVRYTYEDYLATPEDAARRHEVIDGELFVTAAPRWRHQEVLLNLGRVLLGVVIEHGLGKVATAPTVRLRDDLVMEPDLVFLRSEHLDLIEAGRVHGPPDLVVEILSPSNRGFDRRLKRQRYLESGVGEVWIVDADDNTIEVWRPGEEPQMISSGSIEWQVGERTFQVALAEIFRS
jgi:Uma2 family endonuclease